MSTVPVRTVQVRTASPYDVVIAQGCARQVPAHLPSGCARVAVLHAPAVQVLAASIADGLRAAGQHVLLVQLPDAEAAKDIATVAGCWDRLAQEGFTRSDAVVSVGGGATTDAAGFIAATWLRGVAVIHVPTTTLAMVDAAVGGKTGINIGAGKNLVGSFHEPSAVLVDLAALAVLPAAEHVAGLAEVVKAGFIDDRRILELVDSSPEQAADPASPLVAELVERAIRVKADVVAGDLRETAGAPRSREILNYGHTLAHAIEQVEQYTWRHGHAVSVGMVFAGEVAERIGLLDSADLERHRRTLAAVGLPVRYDGAADWSAIRATMSLDKKARGRGLRLVLLRGIADAVVVDAPDEAVLEAAFEAVRAP